MRIANEYERAVVFRLGRLRGTRGPGLYWLIPLGIETQRKVRSHHVFYYLVEPLDQGEVRAGVRASLGKVIGPSFARADVPNVVFRP